MNTHDPKGRRGFLRLMGLTSVATVAGPFSWLSDRPKVHQVPSTPCAPPEYIARTFGLKIQVSEETTLVWMTNPDGFVPYSRLQV